MSASGHCPLTLKDQLAELRRERLMRERVYPTFVQRGKLTQYKADLQMNALDGAIATLQRLVDDDEKQAKLDL